MLLTTRTSLKWRRRTFLLFLALTVSYVWYEIREPFTHGGSLVGLIYGAIATALILLLIFFAVRKRAYGARLGSLEEWCQSHVYLGLLVVAVVLAHSGFRFEDKVAIACLVAMGLVALSGLLGAILYTMVPRMLTEVGSDPPPQDIASELNKLRKSMTRLADGKSPALRKVHALLDKEAKPIVLAGWRILGGQFERSATDEKLKGLLRTVPAAEQEDLKRLLVIFRQHRELHQQLVSQQRYRNLLQLWLYVHVPLTVALVLLVAAHLFGVFYYTPLKQMLAG
jgi:hypothetical protein